MCQITLLFDNEAVHPGCEPSWGYAALIERGEEKFLFDTGAKPEVLEKNVRALSVDLKDVKAIVLSHHHWDHTGGLDFAVSEVKKPRIYAGVSYAEEIAKKYPQAEVIPVGKEPIEIAERIFLTGELEGPVKEVSLFWKAKKGVVIITGCAHPGAVNIVKKVKELVSEPLLLLLGGIHLYRSHLAEVERTSQALKNLGLKFLGVSHCTGEKAINFLQQDWGERFLKVGAGSVINLLKEPFK